MNMLRTSFRTRRSNSSRTCIASSIAPAWSSSRCVADRSRPRPARSFVLDFLPETTEISAAIGGSRSASAGTSTIAVWRSPDRPTEDDDQCAQLGRKVFMADLEDANSPTWSNVVDGQVNLYDAVAARSLRQSPTARSTDSADQRDPRGPPTRLAPGRAPPRRRRRAISGVARRLRSVLLSQCRRRRCAGHRSLLLPARRLESHLEARLWNDVFNLRAGRARHPAAAPSGPPC